ncbi:hypothetical protein GCM10007160_38060 [Litchfieldella qijiaojingensis]|uniref:Integral membrane protein n=1 Tax=Litchfieldella qijiaojingensis TaxID=980347 RepID=A0ABQ2Z7B9_9GAMM|nr:hypothetical protein [Halomonas qijiaojingensis]GGY06989.1 hypothetical protein GCM10007160_38060 [Halomonas qijiaojingensis]
MQGFWLPLGMAAIFGAFTGLLFRLSDKPGHERPFMFPLLGVVAGIMAFFIHQALTWIANAPNWLLPALVVLLIWLWLGRSNLRFRRSKE